MPDAVTGLIGAVLMITFLLLIAAKLNQLALWIVFLSGIALMLWAYWSDALEGLLNRRSRSD